MYTSYYGFTEKPFATTPDGRYFYLNSSNRDTLAGLKNWLDHGMGHAVLLGELGTGKTTLCLHLAEELPDETSVTIISSPPQNSTELITTICARLIPGFQPPEPPFDAATLVRELHQQLLENSQVTTQSLLIVDQAHQLQPDSLKQLQTLSALEANGIQLLRLLLAGENELKQNLDTQDLSRLRGHIQTMLVTSPLASNDVHNYILSRIQTAGCDNLDLFSQKAMSHLTDVTGGIPRLLNIVCDRALRIAHASQSRQVDIQAARQAASEIFPLTTTRSPKGRYRLGISALALAVMVILIMFILNFTPEDKTSIPEETAVNPQLSNPQPPPPPAPRDTSSARKMNESTGEKMVEDHDVPNRIRINPPLKLTSKKELFTTPEEMSDTGGE